MKFTIAYYLLLLYASVILQPLLPLVSNAWEHAFDLPQHLATRHVKGAQHLEKELAENAASNQTQDQRQPLQNEVTVHLAISYPQYTVGVQFVLRSYPVPPPLDPCTVFQTKHFPPPKFC